jgi:hypothetical protein
VGTLAAVDFSAFTFPGVGTYEAGPAIDALKTKHIAPTGPTANFASNAPRLQTIKSTSMASPGCAYPHLTPTRMFFLQILRNMSIVCVYSLLYKTSISILSPNRHFYTRPGTYSGGNKWIKMDHHFKAPQAQQRISFARVRLHCPVFLFHRSWNGVLDRPAGHTASIHRPMHIPRLPRVHVH